MLRVVAVTALPACQAVYSYVNAIRFQQNKQNYTEV